ncbi:MAG: sulfotransferase [Parvibaculum sp.]|nr:sulfotransferase [Parvibaculum sp.]
MSLKLIGAGFGRTGTLSLKAALETLGLGPCHHMIEVFGNPKQAPTWTAAARGEPVDWEKLLTGYTATIDWPSCHFWRELALRFPDAKVLLTVRDPEKWFSSFADTIMKVITGSAPKGVVDPALMAVGEMAGLIVREKTFSGNLDKAHILKVYNDHIATVKRTIPPERLLVYEVSEGWEPLSKFMNVPVPAADFPRTNSREEFGAHLTK